MRVVLDTNVLLGAPISPYGPPDAIYRAWRAWRAARFEFVTSAIQLEELRRASRYPKFKSILQPHRVRRHDQQHVARGHRRAAADQR